MKSKKDTKESDSQKPIGEEISSTEVVVQFPLKKILFTNKKGIVVLAVIVIAVAAGLPSVYFYNQYQHSQKLLKDPTAAAREEVLGIIQKIARIIELPQGEDPTVATVSDKSKLASQPFFARAENGDKVLIYKGAKKAFLYRPAQNKIIEVAPVTADDPGEQNQVLGANATPSGTISGVPTPSVPQELTVAIYNGTTTVGLARKMEQQILGKVENFKVIAKSNAADTAVAETQVIDITGKYGALAEKLAQASGGEIGTLPKGELKPEADFLIIVGANFQ